MRLCRTRDCLLRLVVLACVIVAIGQAAIAQDFRVVTSVSQRTAGDSRWENVGHSVTLFHAGKVYDYMESVGEVVILEPTQNQFLILSVKGNNLATSLQFPELQRYLTVARNDTQVHIQQLADGGAGSVRRREALMFQLNPEFDESFDPATKTLTLMSPLLRYEIETETTDRRVVAQQYLQYADWTARMNYILHSGALFPDVRLAVNQSLLKRERIPTQVRLLLEGDVPMHLKADHKFEWTLGSIDHAIIRQCEKACTSDETRWVNFREYQRRLVADVPTK